MDKIWLKSYPEGMPTEIDITQYRSVTQILEESFRKFADRKAFACMDKSLSYREVDQMSQKFGAWLQSKALKPGARHENHRHHNCDEFFIVLKGHGMIYTDHGDKPSVEGDVVYSPRGCWHGFNNTSNEDVVLVWGWMGAGSIEASGYEVHPESHK